MLANLFRILQTVTVIVAFPHTLNNSHSLVVVFLGFFFTNVIKRACLSN